MLPEQLSIALKEWAVVQRSLLEQHQIILLRKGGIAEDTGDFDLRAHQFLIMPGYEHETERKGDLQPCFGQWLDEEEETRPSVGLIRFSCACHVKDIVRVEDRSKLFDLMPQHVWSRQFIDARFEWEPYKPVFVLLVRAYRLPIPVLVPYQMRYGGCRSWVDLDTAISTDGSVPAIESETKFDRRLELTKTLLM